MVEDGWVEARTRDDSTIVSRRFGITTVRLMQETKNGLRFEGEIEILGRVVQTGTYRGTLEEVKRQIYDCAITLVRRALAELKYQKNEIPSEG